MSGKVGMPAGLHLSIFGRVCHDAFGEVAYVVGSALETRQWRDVDVRVLLDDDVYDEMFEPAIAPAHMNPKWNAYCMAFSELGRRMTGLPIDFQIQRVSDANEDYPGPRSALIGDFPIATEGGDRG